MTAKALRNSLLRTKFKVGDMVTLPRTIWSRLTSKMINFDRVEVEVAEVGDTIIEHGKNRLCRFAIKLGHGTTSLFSDKVVWEEWMLDRITVLIKASPLNLQITHGSGSQMIRENKSLGFVEVTE